MIYGHHINYLKYANNIPAQFICYSIWTLYQHQQTYHQTFMNRIVPLSQTFNNVPPPPAQTMQESTDTVIFILRCYFVTHFDSMDAKVSQRSTIQTNIHAINKRLNSMDKRIVDIEESTVFPSEIYDDLLLTEYQRGKNIHLCITKLTSC